MKFNLLLRFKKFKSNIMVLKIKIKKLEIRIDYNLFIMGILKINSLTKKIFIFKKKVQKIFLNLIAENW